MHRECSFYGELTTSPDGRRRGFYPNVLLPFLDGISGAGLRWFGCGGISPLEWERSELDEFTSCVGEEMARRGLRMSSYHFSGVTFSEDGDAELRENMAASVEAFAPWKPKCFVLHAGWLAPWPVDTAAYYGELCGRFGPAYVFRRVTGNIAYLADLLAPLGVSLAVETMGRLQQPYGYPESCLAIADALDRPNIGVCLDSGHMLASGVAPETAVPPLKGRLLETHFHDNMGLKDDHLPVGFGATNWLAVQAALDGIGFDGPVTFETGGWPGQPSLADSLRLAAAWWRALETQAELPRK